MRRQSLHDSLTGLPEPGPVPATAVAEAIADDPDGETELAVFVMNLDRFKEVNDALGREIGDGLLQEVGTRLRNVLREGDSVARLGGDEFAVLVRGGKPRPGPGGRPQGARRPRAPGRARRADLHVEASIGIACYPRDGFDVDSLLRCADTAMYVAKDTKLGYAFYDASVDTRASKRLALIGELRRGLDEEELVLHYQPKLAVRSGRVVGVEALVRWQDPDRGLVMPDEFIPAARETSIIKVVTRHVLDEAGRQWRAWADEGRSLADLRQPLHARPGRPRPARRDRDAARQLGDACDDAQARGHRGRRSRTTRPGPRTCSNASGHGPAPVGRRLRDRALVPGVAEAAPDRRDQDRPVVRGGHGRPRGGRDHRPLDDRARPQPRSEVVAEGVEKRAVMERLAEFGCDVAQGYYLSRPVPPDELAIWLDQHPESGAAVPRKRSFREEPVPENLASA